MPAAVRRLGAAVTVLAALAFFLFGVRAWWSHGESVDQAVWARKASPPRVVTYPNGPRCRER
jgi:hypothetical protein